MNHDNCAKMMSLFLGKVASQHVDEWMKCLKEAPFDHFRVGLSALKPNSIDGKTSGSVFMEGLTIGVALAAASDDPQFPEFLKETENMIQKLEAGELSAGKAPVQ